MTVEQKFSSEPSAEFGLVYESVERLKAQKERKGKKARKVVSREYQLLQALYHNTSEEVTRLLIVCGISDLRESRQLLEKILKNDNSPLIRHEAAFGLGLTEDTSAIPLLVEIGLNDVNDVVRHEASLALGNIGHKSALRPLQDLLKNEREYGRNQIVITSCEIAIHQINYKNRDIA